MTNKQKFRLKCQLSDQKQTPVYFPIYDKEKLKQENISTTKKEEIVDAFIGADFAFSFIFLIAGAFIFYERDENGHVTNVVNMLWSALQYKPFAFAFLALFVVPIILWQVYKKTNGINEANYTMLALGFAISSFLFNVITLLLMALFNATEIKRMNLVKTRIVTPIILLISKALLIQLWFFK